MTFKQWDRAQQEQDSTYGCCVVILNAMLLAIAILVVYWLEIRD